MGNLTFGDVVIMPENDDWRYDDMPSLVCSSFVMEAYRQGGIFPKTTFSSTEFTPKDSYSLNIFDNNWNPPNVCNNIKDNVPYCQMLGDWVLELPGYNSIELYDNMMDSCGSEYTPGC